MNVGGGYRKPSGILGALARNRVHGPLRTPTAPVAHRTVSPIVRAFPAKVLFATAPPVQPGVRSVQLAEQDAAPQILNAGAVAAGTAAPVYAAAPAAETVQSGYINLPMMHATEGVQPNVTALIPALRSMIVQALAAQRPPSWPGQGTGGRFV